MGALSASELFVRKVVQGFEGINLRDIAHLGGEEKFVIVNDLFDACARDPDIIPRVIRCVSGLVPHLRSDKRFRCVTRILRLAEQAPSVTRKDLFHVLDYALMQSLLPLEMIALAGLLADGMLHHAGSYRNACVWGLIRVIPFMHVVNQKEYAQDIFALHQERELEQEVIEALTALIYSMDQQNRVDLAFFILENLKRNESAEVKSFTLELLNKIIPVLPENDRLQVADTVVPLLYFGEEPVTKKSIVFMTSIIGLLEETERVHYAQMMAGLLGRPNVHQLVMESIDRMIPFLNDEEDRVELRNMMNAHQNGRVHDQEEEEQEPLFVEKK